MQKYIGTKIVKASPMTREQHCGLRGWPVPEDENPSDEGYLVEYTDGGKPNLAGFDGYVSWSPKDVFEVAYYVADSLDFGQAITALKRGAKVARKGWNGKGMWLILVPGTHRAQIKPDTPYGNALRESAVIDILPHIDMYTASGAMLVGWLASQSDMLADDWIILS